MQPCRVAVVGEGGPPAESSPADPALSTQVSAVLDGGRGGDGRGVHSRTAATFRDEVKSVFASGTGIAELKVAAAAMKWKLLAKVWKPVERALGNDSSEKRVKRRDINLQLMGDTMLQERPLQCAWVILCGTVWHLLDRDLSQEAGGEAEYQRRLSQVLSTIEQIKRHFESNNWSGARDVARDVVENEIMHLPASEPMIALCTPSQLKFNYANCQSKSKVGARYVLNLCAARMTEAHWEYTQADVAHAAQRLKASAIAKIATANCVDGVLPAWVRTAVATRGKSEMETPGTPLRREMCSSKAPGTPCGLSSKQVVVVCSPSA